MTVLSCSCTDNSLRLQNREFIYSATYRILTDDRAMAAYNVLDGAALSSPHAFPSYFSTYALFDDADASSFMKDVTIDQDAKNATVWTATATWSPIKGASEADAHTSRTDPIIRPVIYSREWEEIQIPVEEGWNQEGLPGIGRTANTFGPIQNAAGQEPSTPIIKSKRIPVVVAKKNFTTLDEIDQLERNFGDSLNDRAYLGYAKGECLFRGMSVSEPKFEGGTSYFTAVIRIACQRGGWNYEMVNRGWKYLDIAGELAEAKVKDPDTGENVPVSEPINLELDGTRTPDGSIGTIINWRHHPYVNFDQIGV